MSVKVNFDKRKIKEKINTKRDKGIEKVCNEALKDANYFCRKDSGTLIDSSITASKPKKGILIWDTPYARKMYFTGIPAKDSNPNASLMWAHKGYEVNKAKYKRMFNEA